MEGKHDDKCTVNLLTVTLRIHFTIFISKLQKYVFLLVVYVSGEVAFAPLVRAHFNCFIATTKNGFYVRMENWHNVIMQEWIGAHQCATM